MAPKIGATWRAVIEMSAENRLPIPEGAARRASWLGHGKTVLAILGSDGVIALKDFRTIGPRIEAKLDELSKDPTPENERLIRAIRATHVRFKIYADGRTTVPDDVRLCLGVPPSAVCFVSLIVADGEVMLQASSRSELADAHEVLEDFEF